jgi:NAD(P)H-hydrate epimerase
MAAEAAMRAGTCYVRAAVPASVAPVMDLRLPEALIHGLEEEDGRHIEAGVRAIADLAPEAGAVVLGPGLGCAEGTFSRGVGSSMPVPMVIEAGGLSAYPSAEAISERPGPTVLISDEAGLGRLLGLPSEEVGARRLASARALVDRAGAVVVLEGDGCVVAAPGGPVAFGPGESGALTANGTGSVLAGLVGTFLARGMDPFAAAAAAVLARSDAGDLAATLVGAGHTVAGDVIQALPEALAPLRD